MDARYKKKYWRYPGSHIKLTIMREPLSRLISLYRFSQKQCLNMPKYGSINQNVCNRTFEKYLVPEKGHDPLNTQIRFVTGSIAEEFENFDANLLMNVYNLAFLTERFDESLAVLYIRFGFPWKVIPYTVSNQNLETSFPDISNSTRDLIYEKLAYEKELYDTASKLLDNHIAAIGNEIFLPILTLLKETNKRVFDECKLKERVGDCIFYDPYRQIGDSCLHECIEEVSKAVVKEIIVKELASPKDSTLLKIMRYRNT